MKKSILQIFTIARMLSTVEKNNSLAISFHSRVQNARICAIVNISFILYKFNNSLVDRPEDFFVLSLEVNSSGEFGDLISI